MKIKKIIIISSVFAVLSCTLAPKYNRPKTPDIALEKDDSTKKSISLISWQEYFQSPDLHRTIQTALFNNRDLRVANINIESAQATHGVVRADLLPTINAVGSQTRQGVPGTFASFMPKTQYRANISLANYEIDFFGKMRSLKKSALEDFLASTQARNVTRVSLIAETANSYAQLLLDRELLKIAEESLQEQKKRYEFSELRYKSGLDSELDLLNAQNTIEETKNNLETYKKLVKQDENALMLLMGVFERSALPQEDVTLSDVKVKEELLNFAPSQSLLLRPDVVQAEHELKSANANIGAARAAFFPSISLTGNYGYASRDAANLFNSKIWTFTPQINLPIFTGGKNIYNLKLADLRKKTEIAQYEKTIQTAFREVLDQLAERESTKNQLESFDKIYANKKRVNDVSKIKHEAGINSAVNVIDDKINFLVAKQNQLTAQKQYLANLITLYKVMGGGSELEVEVK